MVGWSRSTGSFAGFLLAASLLVAQALASPVSAPAAEPTGALKLGRSEGFRYISERVGRSSLWSRETMRQALLLAGRSELGMATLDASLGETVPDDETALEILCVAHQPERIDIVRGPSGKQSLIKSIQWKFEGNSIAQTAWIEQMEILSRGVFVEALREAGYSGKGLSRSKNAAAGLDDQLTKAIDDDLTMEGQFLALRRLHAEIAEDGETRARLAGLVRAYSHLGLITEHLWHPMSYALKARALLYAQRWVVRDPRSALALQHRAYAFALVGMHGAALHDLDDAEKLTMGGDSPRWIPLITAYCKYDFPQLKTFRSGEAQQPLASLLHFLAHEHEGSRTRTVNVGLEVLEQFPNLHRVRDTVAAYTGPGIGQTVTQDGLDHLAATSLASLAAMESLPPKARTIVVKAKAAGAVPSIDDEEPDLLGEISHRTLAIAACRESADEPGEPGWPVLGQLIEETSFITVFRRLRFVRVMIGAPADDYMQVYEPFLINHRLFPFLDAYRARYDKDKYEAAVAAMLRKDVTYVESSLWAFWPSNGNNFCRDQSLYSLESLANEASLKNRAEASNSMTRAIVGNLIDVSPHSPHAMCMELRSKPRDPVKAAWIEAAKSSPALSAQLAVTSRERGETGMPETYLRQAFKLDPSFYHSQLLAQHYQSQGDDENWLKTFDEFLETPDTGLEHAQIRCMIVDYYAKRREWEKALPYADAAGETGAEWAVNWARTVNEVVQNFDKAERWYVFGAQRYGNDPLPWYFFCQRNGCGHLDAAREASMPDGIDDLLLNSTANNNYLALAFQLEGKPEKALKLYAADWEESPSCISAMKAVIVADQIGDAKVRDQMLKHVRDQKEDSPPSKDDKRPYRSELVELARQIQSDLAKGGKAELDFDMLHAARDAVLERDRCTFNCLLGCYLEQHGKPDLALSYWKLCMREADLVLSTRTLAGFKLQQKGVKPSEWKSLLFAAPKPAPTERTMQP